MSKTKHPIAVILEHYGAKIPLGTGWMKIRCPFHGDSHASATVNTEINAFKCFACEVSGDTYGIIMKYERKTFHEAYTLAEEVTGISGDTLSEIHRAGRGVSSKQRSNSARRGYTPPRGRRRTTARS